MKTRALTLLPFALTALVVMLTPHLAALVRHDPEQTTAARGSTLAQPPQDQRPRVDVVFVLDTTGSMGGLIQAAKEKIWSVATTLASAQPTPTIRLGLVAYRDRGDDYVTRVFDLSQDLDSLYAQLMDFDAHGGGDGPESVNQALHDAVHAMSWDSRPNTYRSIFLVGDAPGHSDYPNDRQYPEIMRDAKQRGIVINTIQCGQNGDAMRQWQHIAQLGQGNYVQVNQAGSAVAITTPFDKQLATLSHELDDTRLYYGDSEVKAEQKKKMAASDKLHSAASAPSRARRAAFNATPSGKANLLGENELIDAVSSGRVALSSIDRDELPASMQALAPEEQHAVIEQRAERRERLEKQIANVVRQRDDYLKEKVAASGGAEDSLDHQLYGTVRAQAAEKGLSLSDEGPDY